LIHEPTPPTKATIIAPLTGVSAIVATQSRTFFMGGVRARTYPVTRMRIICMAKAMIP